MLVGVHPKLPMRNKTITRAFYGDKLGFVNVGSKDYDGYLMMRREEVEIHFFEFVNLNPYTNYAQIYIRTSSIESLYNSLLSNHTPIHPNGKLEVKPWNQIEFSVLDPDHNLLTFGESKSTH